MIQYKLQYISFVSQLLGVRHIISYIIIFKFHIMSCTYIFSVSVHPTHESFPSIKKSLFIYVLLAYFLKLNVPDFICLSKIPDTSISGHPLLSPLRRLCHVYVYFLSLFIYQHMTAFLIIICMSFLSAFFKIELYLLLDQF